MGIIYTYVQAAEDFVGTDTHHWDSKANVFPWLLFHVEMLVMGPKRKKLGRQKETINECDIWRSNLFCCGHINLLWDELRRSRNWMLGMSRLPTQEENDKSAQDTVDKDNYLTSYALAVKPPMIAPITGKKCHIVSNKSPQLHYGYSWAPFFLVYLKPNQVQWPVQELSGDIINSIWSLNKVKAMGCSWILWMSWSD